MTEPPAPTAGVDDTSASSPSGWQPGELLAEQSYVVTRADLVRYAGASGDFNPIHWSDRVARSVGLPGVIAHGMLTLSLAARALTTWVGDPSKVESFGARFVRPVVVPDDDAGTQVTVTGVVAAVETGRATVELEVTAAGVKVLGAPRAVVRC